MFTSPENKNVFSLSRKALSNMPANHEKCLRRDDKLALARKTLFSGKFLFRDLPVCNSLEFLKSRRSPTDSNSAESARGVVSYDICSAKNYPDQNIRFVPRCSEYFIRR